ncbi:zf-DHHC-domain-containing protein [Tothia fuscella]|uniref:Palmitoyltransferase n=1 Tax=Tothia fuscella TaxID=1048955 RepID=A0A9P4U1D4_9PEZI|nr:zf-DHHC-domain-containing protein [Tothia fuscella]
MATLAPPESYSPNRRRGKSCVRMCERYCCNVLTYFPLVFVYGLTSWAVWVQADMNLKKGSWWGYFLALLGILLYGLLNWSYTTAVFTDPGSPLTTTPGYSFLPTTEPRPYSSLTVKSSGEMRFCKKCQAKKPDRAHHCSTCRRCVLKMDHHCPWLATCVGLRNYKCFLLFLIYTCLFCWLCFAVSAMWMYSSIVIDGSIEDSLMPVNYILLSVLSGIIGLVISGFTAWHIHLTASGSTTIESLEKTRYLSPLRAQMQSHLSPQRTYVDDEHHNLGEQLRDFGDTITQIHANALPGVLRPEEGEERMSPAQNSLRRNYDWDAQERQRERDRYNEYLDEEDNSKLPNAFNLGWKKNMTAVMGPDPWLWWLPVCNSLGDGWTWEPSDKWKEARDQIRTRRQEESRQQAEREVQAGWARSPADAPTRQDYAQHVETMQYGKFPWTPQQRNGVSTPGQVDRGIGKRQDEDDDSGSTPLRNRSPANGTEDGYDISSDEEVADSKARLLRVQHEPHPGSRVQENWNDLPDDMVKGRRRSPRGGSRRGR